jgi:aryl-alcohol dehydrogenase-like predicted oxidoreductase
MDLSTWQGMRTRDPRRLALGIPRWNAPDRIVRGLGEFDSKALGAVLARAKRAGMRAIDTARADGEGEAQIGRAIADDRGWRVITQLDPEVHREGQGIVETLARVDASLGASRQALGLETLPVLLLDRFSHRHACGGRLWRRLLAEREAGRIDALGVSAVTPDEAWAALQHPDIEVIQVASSLLDLRLYRQGFFPRARELGRTVYVRSVFLEGVADLDPAALSGPLAGLASAMQIIHACAARLHVTPRALFLAFAQSLPGAHPILPCDSDAQLEELLANWASEAIDLAALTVLIESLPTLHADAVEPARWKSHGEGRNRARNQTRPASIATIGN